MNAEFLPVPGSLWRHFRTKAIYEVLEVGFNTEVENELMVVYRKSGKLDKSDNFIWIRPYRKLNKADTRSCWNDVVDENGTKRFELIGNC